MDIKEIKIKKNKIIQVNGKSYLRLADLSEADVEKCPAIKNAKDLKYSADNKGRLIIEPC